MSKSLTRSDHVYAELCRREVSEEGRLLWRENHKVTMIASAITSPISAFLIGFLLHRPGSTLWASVGAGLLTALLTIPIVMLIVWGYFRLLAAPRSLYKKTRRDLISAESLLEEERAKNAEPKLKGQMVCLTSDTGSPEGVKPSVGVRARVGFYLTLNLNLWNESAAATTVAGFTLELIYKDVRYRGERIPVQGYYVLRVIKHPEPRVEDEPRTEDLVEFPTDVEITNKNHQPGWLRFHVSEFPLEATHKARLENVGLEICALDRKGLPHRIYEGTCDLPPCGDIRLKYGLVFA